MMKVNQDDPQYHAFLLRCWCEAGQWRYSLEQVGNGRRLGFASLIDLATFLHEQEKSLSHDRPLKSKGQKQGK